MKKFVLAALFSLSAIAGEEVQLSCASSLSKKTLVEIIKKTNTTFSLRVHMKEGHVDYFASTPNGPLTSAPGEGDLVLLGTGVHLKESLKQLSGIMLNLYENKQKGVLSMDSVLYALECSTEGKK